MSGSRCADITRTSWRMPRSSSSLRGLLHRGHVALGAHDDADARGVDLHARRARPRPRSRWRARGAGCSLMPERDVPAQLAPVERRSCRRQHTRRPGRLATSSPERGHVEHAPAGGDDLAVALGGARVGDLDAGRHAVEPADHVARGRRLAGSRARRARRSPPRARPTRARRPPSPPGSRRALEQVEQVRAQARQHDLRLRIAEADVELEHLRRRRRSASARRRGRRGTACRGARSSSTTGWWHACATISASSAASISATGEYAPMPPVFGPVSPSPMRLKSRAGRERHRALAVAQREQRQLVAVAGTPRPRTGCVAEAPLDEHRLERRARLAPRRRRSRRPCRPPARRP